MSAPAPPQHGAPGALPSVADPLETFTVARKGVQLTLTPVLATNSARDAELREAAISLYHHVLPSVGRKLVRTILEGERARTIMLMRSVEGARTVATRTHARAPALARSHARAPHRARRLVGPSSRCGFADVLAERELAAGAVGAAAKAPAATGGCPAEDEDADDAATSSFSGPSDGEDESGDGGGTGSDADAEEGDEEEGEEEAGDGEEEGAAAPGAEPAVRAKHRIVGAASFELVEPSQCPRGLAVLQLTLIGVRTKHQQLGLGSQLLRRAVDPRLAGPHDTLLAFADHDAVDFFRRHGFTDDVIVTSQFRAVVDSWEQSVLMVRSVVPVPPRAGFELHAEPADAASVAPRSAVLCPPATLTEPRYASAADVGDAIDAWREQRLQSYSQELGLLERLRGEVQTLRRRSVRQDDYVSFLIAQLAQLTHERDAVAAEYAAYRARAEPVLAAAASGAPRPDDDGEAAPGGDGRVDAARRLAQVEPASRLFGRLAESFAASLRPSEHACPPLAAVRIWQLASDAERAARRARYDMSRGPAAADSSAGGSRFELELYLGAPLAVLQQVRAPPMARHGACRAAVGARARAVPCPRAASHLLHTCRAALTRALRWSRAGAGLWVRRVRLAAEARVSRAPRGVRRGRVPQPIRLQGAPLRRRLRARAARGRRPAQRADGRAA